MTSDNDLNIVPKYSSEPESDQQTIDASLSEQRIDDVVFKTVAVEEPPSTSFKLLTRKSPQEDFSVVSDENNADKVLFNSLLVLLCTLVLSP